jgi:hypothetical protein
MKFIELFAILLFCSAATFTIVDIGIDGALVKEYANKQYCSATGRYEWSRYRTWDSNSRTSCVDPLGGVVLGTLSIGSSFIYMILTAVWILLGGILQSSIIIYFHIKKDQRLLSLPTPVRFLVWITAPILMAPVILNLYGAYQIFTKKSQEDITRTMNMAAALKVAEVGLESLPQLGTQWSAASNMVSYSNGKIGMTPIQSISIATSTVTIIISVMSRISLARQKEFISSRYPAWASLAPMFLFLLVGVTAGSTQLRFGMAIDRPDPDFDAMMLSYFVLNVAATLFALLVAAIPCRNLCWRISRTVIHFMLTAGAVTCIIFDIVTDWAPLHSNLEGTKAFHMFYFNVFVTISHCLLGLLILPSKEISARLFAPLIFLLIKGFRKLGSCCCFVRCQTDIEEYLDCVESTRVGGEEEGEGKH